ncbi:hypothetical protein [Burkholderia pseudomultivorans]|uniref:hypothetical protein n=1 Tax=Burkholderia pseudomultivorans TaxID=1207504 RepID=UPI001583EE18|nr:hypothetical protein [Burkholderia pseudomultivorans]
MNVSVIEIIAAATIPVAFVLVIIDRIVNKRGIGARAIQLTAVGMLVPLILILALEKILDGATVGTLIGGIVGYLLSGISEFDKGRDANSSTKKGKNGELPAQSKGTA